ncbi:UNVERIFIED_ORG: cellulase/cellobiase CelA1 [Microbispora rosea subsp. rosea]
MPPSEATTRMFAALSPERLESESLDSGSQNSGSLGSGSLGSGSPSSRSLAPPERRAPSERLVTTAGAGDGGLPGQDRDDPAKQPRRMRRLALVSGLSVLLAVGVTAGGARLIAGRTSLSMEQPTTACPTSENCATADGPYGASGSGQALGETPAPGDPTGDPTGDPAQNGQGDSGKTGVDQGGTGQNDTGKNSAAPQATPVSTTASKGRDRDHASAHTRTPSTAAPRASAHASPRVGDAPAAVTAAPEDTGTASDDGATPGETALDDTDNTGDTGDTGGTGDTAGTDEAGAGPNHTTGPNTAWTRSALAGGGPAVRVRFTVTDRDESGYAARIAVRNEGPALPAWTIRLAVGGQVTAVEGADWRQQGDTLTLSSQAALDEGGTLTLTVHADGASAAPADCVLSEGRCEVTGPGPSRRGD